MLIEISAAAIGGGFVGYFACAAMTMSKVADVRAAPSLKSRADDQLIVRLRLKVSQLTQDHARCADALATKQARIDRALAVETPKAAHGVRKMAAILRGDA